MHSRLIRFWWLLRRSVISMYQHGGLGTSKAAAYSALLSFIPVVSTISALLFQANAESVSRVIAGFLFEVVPPGSEELVRLQFAGGERPASVLILATLVTIWAASGMMASLMEGFQAAYHIPRGRPILKQRGVAILLVFTAVLPTIGASSLILFGDRFQPRVLEWLGFLEVGEQLRGWVLWFGHIFRYLIALGSLALAIGLVYYIAPNRQRRMRYIWVGAIVATALWLLTTLAFGWYVRNLANYNVMYGSIGAVIALMVWMYLLAVIALIGCEFNAESERQADARG